MKQFTVTRYSYEELSDEAKEKAIKNMQDFLHRTLDSEDIEQYLRWKLEAELGGEPNNLDIHFSLSYCQGDGVALYGRVYKEQAPNLKWDDRVAYMQLIKNSWGNHYSHYNTFDVEFYDENWDEIPAGIVGDIGQVMAGQMRDICKELERYGYAHIESEVSRESAITYLTDNYEDEFLIDGTHSPIKVSDMAEVH